MKYNFLNCRASRFVSITIIIFLVSVSQVLAQDKSWPPKEWLDSVHCERGRSGYVCVPSCKGNVVMKTGDTLKDCYLRIWGNNTDVLFPNNFKPKVIPNLEISCIYTNQYLQFGLNRMELSHLTKPLDKEKFWRLIKRKEDVKIYDHIGVKTFTPMFGWSMVLVVANKRPIKIYRVNFFTNDQAHHRKKIIEFINKRYHQNFGYDSFKTDMEMIDYILNEENKASL